MQTFGIEKALKVKCVVYEEGGPGARVVLNSRWREVHTVRVGTPPLTHSHTHTLAYALHTHTLREFTSRFFVNTLYFLYM